MKTITRMWIALLVLWEIAGPVATYAQATDTGFPQAEITNGILHVRIYLPDPEKGYYRGIRFDWSGVMPLLEYQGHGYCGQWFRDYSPTTHDAIMGPVESFTPLGYDNARPGEGFVQIGVGLLARNDTSAYSPFRYYHILDPGSRSLKKSRGRIEFGHRLTDTTWSYDYVKTITLTKGKPELVLHHRLKNTGKRPIETDVYDHNFFLLDGQSTGPGFLLKFPFPLTPESARGLGDLSTIRGDSIVILRPFGERESVYAILHGYGEQAGDYDIRLESREVGLRITADKPLFRLVYWGSAKALCPEPYIHIKVLPGETFSWNIHYECYIIHEN